MNKARCREKGKGQKSPEEEITATVNGSVCALIDELQKAIDWVYLSIQSNGDGAEPSFLFAISREQRQLLSKCTLGTKMLQLADSLSGLLNLTPPEEEGFPPSVNYSGASLIQEAHLEDEDGSFKPSSGEILPTWVGVEVKSEVVEEDQEISHNLKPSSEGTFPRWVGVEVKSERVEDDQEVTHNLSSDSGVGSSSNEGELRKNQVDNLSKEETDEHAANEEVRHSNERESSPKKHTEKRQKGKVCEDCGKVFDTAMAYRTPIDGKGESCPICKMTFIGNSALSKHIKKTHRDAEGPFFSCDKCDRQYRTYDPLRKHQRLRHGGTVKSGISRETTGPIEICQICFKPFKGKYRLSMHVTIDHQGTDVKQFPCDICDQSFRTADILRNHRKKHLVVQDRNYTCSLCTLRFLTHCGLCNHQAQAHGGVLEEVRAMRPRQLTKPCPLCPERFENNREMSKHLGIAHKDSDIKPFSCDICHLQYKSWLSMKSHRRKMHTRTKENSTHRFHCDLCSRRFKKWEGLRSHQNVTHGGMNENGRIQAALRDYGVQCPICSSFYQGKHSLSQHLVIDHPDFDGRIFACKICNKSYRHYAHLRSHRTSFHKIPCKFVKPHCRKPRCKTKISELTEDDPENEVQPEECEDSAFQDIGTTLRRELAAYLERKLQEAREEGAAEEDCTAEERLARTERAIATLDAESDEEGQEDEEEGHEEEGLMDEKGEDEEIDSDEVYAPAIHVVQMMSGEREGYEMVVLVVELFGLWL